MTAAATIAGRVPAPVVPKRPTREGALRPPVPRSRRPARTALAAGAAGLAVVAGALVIGEVAQEDLVRALTHGDRSWAAAALAWSAVPFLGAALSVVAFAPGKAVPFPAAVAAQLAASFATVLVPPTVAQVAVNARFLNRTGHSPAMSAAVVGLTQVAALAVTLLMLAAALLVTGGRADVPAASADLAVLTAGVLALVLAGAGSLVLGRRLTARLLPDVREALPRLRPVLTSPRRLAAGLAGSAVVTAGYIAALDASLRAFGSPLPVAETAIVLLAGIAVGSAAPVPGGVGAVEAALAAGLVAAGTPVEAAVPAVLLFRFATVWARVAPGWLAFAVLRRQGLL